MFTFVTQRRLRYNDYCVWALTKAESSEAYVKQSLYTQVCVHVK